MQELSLQQKAAVQHIRSPLLILAGAGCGKTSLLARKIVWLIREHGVAPSAIVALAATDSTVRALGSRVAEALGHKAPELAISTFAEFGLAVVQERPEALGLRPGFSLYDRQESEALVARLLRETQPDAVALAGAVRERIAAWKRRALVTPPAAGTGSPAAGLAARLYEIYQRRLQAANAIDLEDTARKARERYLADAALLGDWRRRVRFLLLDEYEQGSAEEHELVRLLAANGAIVTLAADDQQPDADGDPEAGERLARLPSVFPGLRLIRLDHNFRATRYIAQLTQRLSTSSRPVPAAPARRAVTSGSPVRALTARTDQHEAEALVGMLLDHKLRGGVDYSQYAILIRRAELAAPIEHALRVRRVPYHVRGISSFFGQTEVRDLWAYLRLLCNPADDNAFLHVIHTPRRDIDHATLERLAAAAGGRGLALLECALEPDLERTLAGAKLEPLREVAGLVQRLRERAEGSAPGRLVRDLLDELHYEEWLHDTCNDANIAARRMSNVMRFVETLERLARRRPGADLPALIARLHLEAVRDGQADRDVSDGVALMTISAARGMEFAHVYLVGFEEAGESEEQARARHAAYIGAGRAREDLIFTVAEYRRSAGAGSPRRPSRLLTDLPPQMIEWLDADAAPGRLEHALARGAPYLHRGPPPSRRKRP